MSYHYQFENTIVGNFGLTRTEYLRLHEGYGLLRGELEKWNERVVGHGAMGQPYKQEVADLDHMIQWGNDQLAQKRQDIVVNGISIGSLRYAKAALMFWIWKREQNRLQKAQEGWPEGALRTLSDSIDQVRRIADAINYEPSEVLWEVSPKQMIASENQHAPESQWDVFISHASEDKDQFARPLADELRKQGLRVWFDEFTLSIGDSLRRSIDSGLARSRFGVVIISPDFLSKEWPQKELDGLVAREVDGIKVILPVWHKITAKEVRDRSPTLGDRLAASSDKGLDHVVAELVGVIRDAGVRSTEAGAVKGPIPRGQLSEGETTRQSGKEEMIREVGDLWVNMEYPQKLGLIEKLTTEGYDLKWDRAIDEAASVDLYGWEYVTIDRAGQLVRLKIRDAPIVGGHMVLLKKRKRPEK